MKSFRNQQFHRLTDELLGRIPEQGAGGFIGIPNNALLVHDEHRVRGELQQPLRNGANFGHYDPKDPIPTVSPHLLECITLVTISQFPFAGAKRLRGRRCPVYYGSGANSCGKSRLCAAHQTGTLVGVNRTEQTSTG
jgi:hypothetical protein